VSQQRFVVDETVFTRLPGMRIVVASAGGIDNTSSRPEIDLALDEAWNHAHQLAEKFPNAQSHPHVACWRDALHRLGVSPHEYPASIEAMLRRAFKIAQPFRINPMADLIHAVSLRHVVPVGGFDLDNVDGDFVLRPTRAGEPFLGLDSAEPMPVEADEVAYADNSAIHTRHFVWRQAKTSLIDADTQRVVLVAEVLPTLDARIVDLVAVDFTNGLKHFAVDPVVRIIDAATPTLALPR
jgi:DNA/RNA-binding domain of Phe-tRNA-synthetase-like protein